ncbi:MAG: hypothetical protein MUC85_00025 [Anaerolineales bacterium]|jgi:hypothetical protein|nr:hypothetical protein [Anaerolineales bacterium]
MLQRWLLLGILACLVGCSLFPSAPAEILANPLPKWQYADLRALDAADGDQSTADVLALYTRVRSEQAQIRLDYLDYPMRPDHDLRVFLYAHNPYSLEAKERGAAWDFQILIPADSSPEMTRQDLIPLPGVELRVERDSVSDTIVITFQAKAIRQPVSRMQIAVELTAAGGNAILDEIPPSAWQSPPPPRQPVILGFWNTFAAATPAQALRRWDGAHSGPDSSRHGLGNLLVAVEQTGTPVILFDLKTPASLSALDHLGVLPMIRKLAAEGLVLLPTPPPFESQDSPRLEIPETASARIFAINQRIAADFGLASPPPGWEDSSSKSADHGLFVFWKCLVDERCYCVEEEWGYGYAHYTIPRNVLTSQGLTLEAKRTIAEHASSRDRRAILLGGDLSQSSWGEPEAAHAALAYIASHPWLKALDVYEQQNYRENNIHCTPPEPTLEPQQLYAPDGQTLPSGLNSAQLHARVIEALQGAPDTPFTELAWDMYASLLGPSPDSLYDLRLGYLGSIGHLLRAAQWSLDPQPVSDCASDLDWDGVPECTLASESLFLIFESEGGGITMAAAQRVGEGIQVLAPTYQFFVGLGDPTTWNRMKGVAGDPAQLISFTEPANRWTKYEPQVGSGEITFSLDGEPVKRYQLAQDILLVTFFEPGFHSVSIPAVIDPSSRYKPGWSQRLLSTETSGAWQWSLENKLRILVKSQGQIIPMPYNKSQEWLVLPEDPNRAYPVGHYTLFPLGLVRVESQGPLQIEFSISDY